AVAFAPDGATLAVGDTTPDGVAGVRVLDPRSGRDMTPRAMPHEAPVLGLAYDRRGRRIAAGDQGGGVRVWEAATGAPLAATRIEPVTHSPASYQVYGVRFSPDDRLLAVSVFDGTIRLLDAATARPVRMLSGHELGVRDVDFSPDGSLL